MNFTEVKKSLINITEDMQKLKISILGDSSTQFLNIALRGIGAKHSFNLEIFESEFSQIELNILNDQSEYFKFKSEFTILCFSSEILQEEFYKLNDSDKEIFSAKKTEYYKSLITKINESSGSKIIFLNFVEINDFIFGHMTTRIKKTFIHQIRLINNDLIDLSSELENLFILDASSLQNIHGRKNTYDPRLFISSKVVFSLDFWPVIAESIIKIVQSTLGYSKKCLIFDLDNTIWGGVVGDDGIENIQIGNYGIGRAFSTLQRWILELKNRGIILAVVSKNELSTAQNVFRNHPDMLIRLNDIAVFQANWDNKVDNIKRIKEVLNISYDSMVFIDDNKFERESIKSLIPEITVPELPNDPTFYLDYLTELNIFDSTTNTKLDGERVLKYQQESERIIYKNQFNDFEQYLIDLKMTSKVNEFSTFDLPRIVQLSQRSNQFNLTTIRYSSKDVTDIINSKEKIGFSFGLGDRFGDYGLISYVVLYERFKNEFFIENWVMSCRVLKRGMEEFIINYLVEYTKSIGLKKIIGEYIPTKKNIPVLDLFERLGFIYDDNLWVLPINTAKKQKNVIERS